MSFELERQTQSPVRGSTWVVNPAVAAAPGASILVASSCPAAEGLRDDVARHNFSVDIATTGRAVLEVFASYDLILLDTDLPDLDGVSVSRAIRQISMIPIIAFASADEVDQVLLLETGCDDCIERPYRSRDVVARIKAVLRRAAPVASPAADLGSAVRARPRGVPPLAAAGDDVVLGEEQDQLIRVGNRLVIDAALREVCLDGQLLALTRKEYELLHLLASAPGRIFDRTELMIKIWDYPAGKPVNAQASRTIDTHVSSLRRKLRHRDWIANMRGVGFRLDVPGPRRTDRQTPSRLVAPDPGEPLRHGWLRPAGAIESA